MNNSYFLQQEKLIEEIKESLARNRFTSTIVEMQKDYQNDDQMCLSSLAFINKINSTKIISRIIEPLKQTDPDQYYYSVDNLHLTIKNIRTIHKPPLFTQMDITKTNKLFQKLIPYLPSFTLTLKNLVLFPTSLAIFGYSDSSLQKIVQTLDCGLKEIGVPDDKKYVSDKVFFGVSTLVRFTHTPSKEFISKVKESENIKIGEFKINKINLVTCNAVCDFKTRKIIGSYNLK